MKTIAIIDKHPIVRAGLDVFIKSNFTEASVIEFNSFYHFHEVCDNIIPDLFIVGNTIEFPSQQCKMIVKLKHKNKLAKVIIYEDNPDYLKVSLYFKSGVTGYLTKRSDIGELLRCIADVEKGQNYIGKEILDLLLPKWVSPRKNTTSETGISLTHREYEIATFLIDGDSVTEISKKLERKTTTISTIKKNLFRKLKIENLVDLNDSFEKFITRNFSNVQANKMI